MRFILLLCLFISMDVQSQRILYLEDLTEVKPKKFYEGQVVDIQLQDYPDDWLTVRIEELLVTYNLILTNRGIYRLKEISHIRVPRKMISTDGITGVLGLLIRGVKRIFKKHLTHRSYSIGKKYRLKLMDLSFPDAHSTRKNQELRL